MMVDDNENFYFKDMNISHFYAYISQTRLTSVKSIVYDQVPINYNKILNADKLVAATGGTYLIFYTVVAPNNTKTSFSLQVI